MKKAIDGSIRSRLSRRLYQVSLTLLFLTLTYWLVAACVASDFTALDGSPVSFPVSFPAASIAMGHHEFAWVVDSGGLLFCHLSDPAGGTLPLIKPHGFAHAMFQDVTRDSESGSHRNMYVALLATFRSVSRTTGSPVIIQLLYLPLSRLAIVFAIWPALVAISMGWQKARKALAARRMFRRRRIRNAMGRCTCGYDLRQSHARCPECGRAFRRVPVAMPI